MKIPKVLKEFFNLYGYKDVQLTRSFLYPGVCYLTHNNGEYNFLAKRDENSIISYFHFSFLSKEAQKEDDELIDIILKEIKAELGDFYLIDKISKKKIVFPKDKLEFEIFITFQK